MDKRVEIHGTSRVDMNGKRGVATDFHWYEDNSKWRYTVKLDGGEVFKVKRESVRAEGAGASEVPHTCRVLYTTPSDRVS